MFITNGRGQAHGEGGFTLIEVVTCLVIMSLLIIMVLPDVRHAYARVVTRQYIDQLTLNLYSAASYAKARAVPVKVVLNASRGTYQMYFFRPGVAKEEKVPPGYSLFYSFTDGTFAFTAQGHITKAGRITLLDPDMHTTTLTLYMAGGRFIIE
ncbi:prepilin-type N-terminal cleavage/methylation domain-containing protein [Aneurinibacillus sp. Ricciae_BoGa-3]|uniref:prepilin-type N-terminal cleavage/methylation domain-containing protein n=1 Tax=Aneurinibacillus sp. Ricciae_BoGa-3 TaxID=3022697 RepID=UPI0023415726|nr:prepilin-type N-terminal cleavage/methylation domain-containing protein [Aneurinibacillus sp. Ricciae_BoGa-3]WCK53350.1 prepilin-type N-terminal cleavage/methylation domain-containing protein [Aneurinibacillus sp. Ricciae_BoGa-3]